jgi:hypothetical protein
MSFKAELNLEGKTYQVKRFRLSVEREFDKRGRPGSLPKWTLIIVLDSSEDKNLTNWMMEADQKKQGILTIYKIDESSKMKEIEFKNSYCGEMNNTFMIDKGYTSCEMFIIGQDIRIDSTAIINSWAGYDKYAETRSQNH